MVGRRTSRDLPAVTGVEAGSRAGVARRRSPLPAGRAGLVAGKSVLRSGVLLSVLGSMVWAQQLPRVDVEGTLRVTPLGEGVIEIHYRYPGNLYNTVKQLYASNPYVLFRSLTGENQPRVYVDRKSLKIEFDDANRVLRLDLTIPDLFRYTPDGWRLQVPELLANCKAATQERDRVIVSCAYTQSNALTAGQTVQYMETSTIVLPPGAQWVDFNPKEGDVTYRLDLPLTAQYPGLWPWVLTLGTVLVGLLALVTWLIRVPPPAAAVRAAPAGLSATPAVQAGRAPAVLPSTPVGAVPVVSSAEPTAPFAGETIALSVLTLVGVQGAVQGQSFPVPPTGVVIGRDAGSAQVVIPDPHVSRRQAQIRRNAQGQFVLVNLSQTNPTLVNGQPVMAEHTLRPGDRIQVAGHVLEVRT